MVVIISSSSQATGNLLIEIKAEQEKLSIIEYLQKIENESDKINTDQNYKL